MAETKKPSRAEKAVSDVKKKETGSKNAKSTKKTDTKKNTKKAAVKTEYDNPIPVNLITAVVCFGLFTLFLIICFYPEGWLMQMLLAFIQGLIGKVGFYFTIPVLFFLGCIYGFRKKNPVAMRTFCLISLVLLCGTVSHLCMPEQTFSGGFKTIAELFTGGSEGTTAGVICGSIAILLDSACGDLVSFILLGICIVLCLLGSVQLTIPSLIRAYLNRPREEFFEEDEEEEVPEPAQVVVNHIVNKRIEQKRQRRMQMEESFEEPITVEPPAPAVRSRASTVRVIEEKAVPTVEPNKKEVKPQLTKAQDMLSQIECEIGAPVAAASSYAKDPEATIPPMSAKPVVVEVEDDFIPSSMPVFTPDAPIPEAPKTEPKSKSAAAEAKSEKVTAKEARESAQLVAEEIAQAQNVAKPEYCFPPINLLNPPMRSGSNGTDEMRENSRRLNETLASFKIDAHIINVTRGPSVTRYEVELDKGVRLNKLTTCADDIALSLGASGVRIAAVPGKISVVGIEVPNRSVTMVSLREVIDSPEFEKSKSKSSFAVGKDIGGSCIIGNIAKMPHMLIAGTTGSGKSVCMNSIILSLLYKAGPEDVKLIMVDPKMVELANYNGIPHLMIPVVTDPKKAAGSLQWAVTEMMRRYKTMSDAGVRDLESFNSIVTAEGGEKVPQLIVIIDELADLMLVAAKEVEDSICRIAQMGRAAGIHLVIATQRPSADVITGLMKANIPSRIAFSVASAMESRIILDTQGA